MQYTRLESIPASTRTVTYKVICDLCKNEITCEAFDAEEVEISHTVGSSFPEGGSGTKTIFDLCGECFDHKLVPWLKSQGAEPIEKEWDF